jgi:transposase-like protein
MDKFYFLVLEQNRSIRSTAKELNIPNATAQSWHKRGLESLEKDQELGIRKPGS